MLDTNISHALGLHMHQPPGNLALLIEANPWEAEQIIRCYERPTRYAQQYADVGHLHIGFSGILLEQFQDPAIVDRYRHIIDIPAMLDAYRNTPNIELIGMGYFHPIFPLIPPADWEEQLRSGRELMAEIFGRAPRGFWPPEMAFSMELIPALVRAGYEYVVVDGVHVHPEDGVTDVFRPYLACHDGDCITVVPRDRDVSNAQESGLDASWFAHEVTHRCRFSPRPHEPRLCTTWSDGENGGWFRQTHEGSGFFGHYFAPYMEHVRGGEYPIRPVGLSDYLAAHPASAQAHVQTGAWNVGSTSGFDLSQWAGSEGQQRGAETVRELSRRWWSLRDAGRADAHRLAQARRLLLESQTSCYLFWGDDWLPKLAALTAATEKLVDELEQAARAPAPAPVPVAAQKATAPAAARPERSTAGAESAAAPAASAASGATQSPDGDAVEVPAVAPSPASAPPAAETSLAEREARPSVPAGSKLAGAKGTPAGADAPRPAGKPAAAGQAEPDPESVASPAAEPPADRDAAKTAPAPDAADAKPTADAEPTPKSTAKQAKSAGSDAGPPASSAGKGKPKAEPKAEPKPKAEAKAESETKPKAEAKAESKAKPPANKKKPGNGR
jgi:4-alpha-glucanotransferase